MIEWRGAQNANRSSKKPELVNLAEFPFDRALALKTNTAPLSADHRFAEGENEVAPDDRWTTEFVSPIQTHF
jgi:hypothetical protein